MTLLQVDDPPAKKKRIKTKKPRNSSPSPPSSSPSFSLLPDEIAVNCLARISRSYYPTLSILSKSFHSLVSSTDLYASRSHIGTTEKCIYVCLRNNVDYFPQWFYLWIGPNQTLPHGMIKKKKKTRRLLVPIPSSDSRLIAKSIVVVGSEIYIIGGSVQNSPSSAVRVLDCRSHTWRDAPNMNVGRKSPLSCVCDGKIYVFLVCHRSEEEPWGEVFDTKTQTWEGLPDPGIEIRKCPVYRIVAVEGKIHFWTGRKYPSYDPKQDKWEWCEDLKLFREMSEPKECIVDNVSYRFGRCVYGYGGYGCWWFDIKDSRWKAVKGLDSLGDKYKTNGGKMGHKAEIYSYGGKLLIFWLGYKGCRIRKVKIWCAEISLDMHRHDGEIWGNVEWLDVVSTVSSSFEIFQSLAVSV